MDNENKFWLSVMSIIGLCAVVLIATVGGCTMQQNKAIATNADPMAAACAINGNPTVCIAVGSRDTHR